MEILLVPHPILRQKAKKLEDIREEDIKIANKMMDTMKKAPGIGLAAVQIGILKRLVVIDLSKDEEKKNPLFLSYLFLDSDI